jgi:hypothetical protein
MSLTCHRCERVIGTTRIVIGGLVVCPICVYKTEYPEADHTMVKRPRARKVKQDEMFPREEYGC